MTLQSTPNESNLCDVCGATVEDCKQAVVEATTDWALVSAAAVVNPEIDSAAQRILNEWRTHALPACNPLAVS